jgi:triosephosphate isomerase
MKMNLLKNEIDSYLEKLKNHNLQNVIFCPTSIYLPYFIKNNLNVGIQNISRYETGSHTGQISIKQISSLNIKYSIIGHSETKNNLMEINEKIKLCAKYNIIPIICIGERKQQSIEDTKKLLEQSIDIILKDINLNKAIIAYEPIWMIGTNKTINTKALHDISNFLKNLFQKYPLDDIMILYGGSVNKNNVKEILKVSSVDGVLIGNASTDIDHFLEILEVA